MTLHLAAKLCEQKLVKVELSAANISVAIPVLGITIGVGAEGTEPIQDTDVAIEKMLQCLKKEKQKASNRY